VFERYLTVWVALCIVAASCWARSRGRGEIPGWSLHPREWRAGGVIPIAICLFFMMYPIMVKIDFASVIEAAGAESRVADAIVNWAIKPFTMYAIACCSWDFCSGVHRRGDDGSGEDAVRSGSGVGSQHGSGVV